jgi:glycosyltransferase involved in cell wall biosynthesis
MSFAVLFTRNLFLPEDLGGNRYPYETIRRLGARGHPVTVVTPRLHDRWPDLPNVRFRFYPVLRPHAMVSHASNLLAGMAALRRERGYPVAIAGSYEAGLAIGVLKIAPLVFLFHSEFYSEWVQRQGPLRRAIRAYMAAFERQVFAYSRRIVAVSRFSARQIANRDPAAGPKIRIVPTGVDTQFFRWPDDGSKRAVREELGWSGEEPLVLGVGRLAGVKQFDRLVTAFAAAVAQGMPGRLVIAGEGPERLRLERLVATYGLADRVCLAGHCEPPRLRALMQAADLQVCSSAFENLSLAILEGMACGTPVLGTPGGGTPELVGVVDPALVLSDDQPHTLADALPSLLADRTRLNELGQRARALCVERYDWEQVVDRLEDVAREAIQA